MMENIKKSKKNLKFTSLAWAFAVMLIAVTILINVAFSYFDTKIDMTPSGNYTLSNTTVDYMNSLDKKVQIYFLMDMDELKKQVEESNEYRELPVLLEEYSKFDNVDFIDIDPNENPEMLEELNHDNFLQLTEGDIVVKCGDNVKKIKSTTMYMTTSETNSSTGNSTVTSQKFQGEGLITGAVKGVAEGITPTLYFLTGHGEKTLGDNYTMLERNIRNSNYDVKEMNLASLESVPEDAAIVVVAAPQQDISSAEKDKLDKYMDKGGNLSLLMSPMNNNTDFNNITELMHEYCLGMDYDRVYETDSSRHVAESKYTIMSKLVDAEEQTDQASSSMDLTSGLTGSSGPSDAQKEVLVNLTDELIKGMAASLPTYMTDSRTFFMYSGTNANDLVICPLLETYDTAQVEAYGGNEKKETDISAINASVSASPLWLAACCEDPYRNHSKMVVMGNADFMDDATQADGYTIVPLYLYLNTISWMSNSDIDMGIATKDKTFDKMTLETKEDTNIVIGIIVAAPVVIAAVGVAIWLKRRNS